MQGSATACIGGASYYEPFLRGLEGGSVRPILATDEIHPTAPVTRGGQSIQFAPMTQGLFRWISIAAAVTVVGCAEKNRYFTTKEPVGRSESHRVVTPVNQIITPYGLQVELPGM